MNLAAARNTNESAHSITINGLQGNCTICHGEGRRPSTILGLDNLITTKLNALNELGPLGAALLDTLADAGLRQQGNDGDTRMPTNNSHDGVCWVGGLDGGKETGGTHDVQGSDSVELGRGIFPGLLEDLGDDGDSRVYRVWAPRSIPCVCVRKETQKRTGDDEHVSIGSVVGNGLSKRRDDGGVSVEQVVTGHARLAGYTSGDNDNLDALERGGKILLRVSGDFAGGVDMADIGSNTRSATDIVKAEGGDEGVRLEEKRQRLADST